MSNIEKNPRVDDFISKAKKWNKELEKLREIVLESDLKEEVKWGVPCYTLNGKNVVLIHGFKEYFAIMFFKGALLKDEKNILIIQTENVQATRQVRFTNLEEIIKLEAVLKNYITEAIEVEKAGIKVEVKKPEELEIPIELENKFKQMQQLEEAFKALTPGRRRAYVLYFKAAKQEKTRIARIEKYIEKILKGKGLND